MLTMSRFTKPLYHFIYKSYHSKKLPWTEWAFLYPTHALCTEFWVLSKWCSKFRPKFPRKHRGNEICIKRLNSDCTEIIIPDWIQSLGVTITVHSQVHTPVPWDWISVSPLPHSEEILRVFTSPFSVCCSIRVSWVTRMSSNFMPSLKSFSMLLCFRHASSFTPSLQS